MSDQNKTYIERTSGLKLKDYAGYAMIDTAGCLVFALVTTLLQKFYTDIFHLSPLFIMIMFIIARVWDGINDPIMGRIADTVKPGKFGRYRKWVLYASPFLTLSAVLMFLKFPGIGEEGHYVATCVYATCTYIFFGMAYTVLQIPYGSLASVVTTDAHERSRLSVWRSIGAALGSIPVLLIASFAYADRLDASGNPVIGENGKVITDMQYAPVIKGVIIMAICSFVMLIIAFLLNKERVKTKPQLPQKGATKKALKLLFKNRAFVAITMVSMLLLAGQMFTQSFYTYLFDDYFHANWMNLATQACTYSPMLIFMFFLPKLTRKKGKKEVTQVGMTLAAGANLVLFFLRGMDPSILMWIFLFKTSTGFKIRAVGYNMTASRFNGFPVLKLMFVSFIVSGAVAGLGGAAELLGTQFRLINGFGAGYGFDGVAMALIGQLNPIATIIVAIFFAALRVGSTTMQALPASSQHT